MPCVPGERPSEGGSALHDLQGAEGMHVDARSASLCGCQDGEVGVAVKVRMDATLQHSQTYGFRQPPTSHSFLFNS